MIYPTRLAIWLIALGAPVAAVLGAVAPELWAVGIAWAAVVAILVLFDGVAGARLADVEVEAPNMAEVGAATPVEVNASFTGQARPRIAYTSLMVDTRLHSRGRLDVLLPYSGARGGSEVWSGQSDLEPNRRGEGEITRLWLRWRGPLKLSWRQAHRAVDKSVAVLPNVAAIRSPEFQVHLRDALFGSLARKFRGEGSEFEALVDFEPGMDRRSIDWKSSARHSQLMAKEYDAERNNQIVFALDCGNAMCQPIAGLPRIDRAVTAALLTSYVALKAGDRTRLFSFAAQPHVSTPFFSGTSNFARIQREAARIDYEHSETNYTLGLSTLANGLNRRSLIVVFTDFTDPTSAELMIESVQHLIGRHLILFVVLDDEELEELRDAEPVTSDRVAESVTAAALLRQRQLVVTKLQRLGIDVIESSHRNVGTHLINSYLKIKRRGQI